MPDTPPQSAWNEPTLAQLRAGAPAPIDDDWKDEIVERLLRELKRQLHQLENSKPVPDEANIRSANVMTLARLERTLDRLLRMEQQRALKRETKVAAKNDDALAALERRLDQIAAEIGAPRPPGKSE